MNESLSLVIIFELKFKKNSKTIICNEYVLRFKGLIEVLL